MRDDKYCNDCDCLSITEEEQDRLKAIAKKEGRCIPPQHGSHYCNKYMKMVAHRGQHPLIPRLNECIAEAESLKEELDNSCIELLQEQITYEPEAAEIVEEHTIMYTGIKNYRR